MTGGFSSEKARNAENVIITRHLYPLNTAYTVNVCVYVLLCFVCSKFSILQVIGEFQKSCRSFSMTFLGEMMEFEIIDSQLFRSGAPFTNMD